MDEKGGPPPEVSAPPPAYSQQPVPEYPGGQAPPGGYYPPPGGSYPPPSGNYPPPAGSYPPPAGSYPPPAGSYQAQPAGSAAPQQVVVVQSAAGTCGKCGVGYRREDFTCCGIALAILFFPLGIICCLLMKESRCSHCGKPM